MEEEGRHKRKTCREKTRHTCRQVACRVCVLLPQSVGDQWVSLGQEFPKKKQCLESVTRLAPAIPRATPTLLLMNVLLPTITGNRPSLELCELLPECSCKLGVKPSSPLTSFEMREVMRSSSPPLEQSTPVPSLLLLNIHREPLSEGVFLLYLPQIIDKMPLTSS